MQLEDDVPCFFGQIQILHGVGSAAGRVGVNHQITILIIASCITNGGYKTLGIAVDGLISVVGSRLVPFVIVIEHLVVSLKEQFLTVVLELLSYLFPQVFVFCLVRIVVGGAGMQPLFAITCIVMHVNDTIHTIVYHVVHHFFHTIHPRIVHLAVLVHLLIPGHWYSNGAKTSILHHLHELWLRNRLSPASLMLCCGGPCLAGISSIEGISQVPAYAHVRNGIFGCFKIGCLYLNCQHQK